MGAKRREDGMTPYFSTYLGELYLGDCLEIMPKLNRRFDVCLTDPPYGIKEAAGKNKSRGNFSSPTDYGDLSWDNTPAPKEAFDLIFQFSDNQIIFGGNYFSQWLKNSPCWIVWDKNTSGDFADAELIFTSFKSAVRIIKWTWSGMRQENMKHKEKRFHPTQKPVGLLEIMLARYVKPESSVLDPFGGVGSTAIACEKNGYPWVLIEQHEPYVERAAKRIEETTNQMRF